MHLQRHSEFLSSTDTKTLFLTLQLNKDQQHSCFTTEKLLFSTLKFCQERLICGLSSRVDQDTNCRTRFLKMIMRKDIYKIGLVFFYTSFRKNP